MEKLIIEDIQELPSGEIAIVYAHEREQVPLEENEKPYRPLVVFGRYGSNHHYGGNGADS